MLVMWHIGLSRLCVSGAEPPSSLGKALNELKQSRDTGTWAIARRARGIRFGNSLRVPFSLKPDGVRTIWKTAPRARDLRYFSRRLSSRNAARSYCERFNTTVIAKRPRPLSIALCLMRRGNRSRSDPCHYSHQAKSGPGSSGNPCRASQTYWYRRSEGSARPFLSPTESAANARRSNSGARAIIFRAGTRCLFRGFREGLRAGTGGRATRGFPLRPAHRCRRKHA